MSSMNPFEDPHRLHFPPFPFKSLRTQTQNQIQNQQQQQHASSSMIQSKLCRNVLPLNSTSTFPDDESKGNNDNHNNSSHNNNFFDDDDEFELLNDSLSLNSNSDKYHDEIDAAENGQYMSFSTVITPTASPIPKQPHQQQITSLSTSKNNNNNNNKAYDDDHHRHHHHLPRSATTSPAMITPNRSQQIAAEQEAKCEFFTERAALADEPSFMCTKPIVLYDPQEDESEQIQQQQNEHQQQQQHQQVHTSSRVAVTSTNVAATTSATSEELHEVVSYLKRYSEIDKQLETVQHDGANHRDNIISNHHHLSVPITPAKAGNVFPTTNASILSPGAPFSPIPFSPIPSASFRTPSKMPNLQLSLASPFSPVIQPVSTANIITPQTHSSIVGTTQPQPQPATSTSVSSTTSTLSQPNSVVFSGRRGQFPLRKLEGDHNTVLDGLLAADKMNNPDMNNDSMQQHIQPHVHTTHTTAAIATNISMPFSSPLPKQQTLHTASMTPIPMRTPKHVRFALPSTNQIVEQSFDQQQQQETSNSLSSPTSTPPPSVTTHDKDMFESFASLSLCSSFDEVSMNGTNDEHGDNTAVSDDFDSLVSVSSLHQSTQPSLPYPTTATKGRIPTPSPNLSFSQLHHYPAPHTTQQHHKSPLEAKISEPDTFAEDHPTNRKRRRTNPDNQLRIGEPVHRKDANRPAAIFESHDHHLRNHNHAHHSTTYLPPKPYCYACHEPSHDSIKQHTAYLSNSHPSSLLFEVRPPSHIAYSPDRHTSDSDSSPERHAYNATFASPNSASSSSDSSHYSPHSPTRLAPLHQHNDTFKSFTYSPLSLSTASSYQHHRRDHRPVLTRSRSRSQTRSLPSPNIRPVRTHHSHSPHRYRSHAAHIDDDDDYDPHYGHHQHCVHSASPDDYSHHDPYTHSPNDRSHHRHSDYHNGRKYDMAPSDYKQDDEICVYHCDRCYSKPKHDARFHGDHHSRHYHRCCNHCDDRLVSPSRQHPSLIGSEQFSTLRRTSEGPSTALLLHSAGSKYLSQILTRAAAKAFVPWSTTASTTPTHPSKFTFARTNTSPTAASFTSTAATAAATALKYSTRASSTVPASSVPYHVGSPQFVHAAYPFAQPMSYVPVLHSPTNSNGNLSANTDKHHTVGTPTANIAKDSTIASSSSVPHVSSPLMVTPPTYTFASAPYPQSHPHLHPYPVAYVIADPTPRGPAPAPMFTYPMHFPTQSILSPTGSQPSLFSPPSATSKSVFFSPTSKSSVSADHTELSIVKQSLQQALVA